MPRFGKRLQHIGATVVIAAATFTGGIVLDRSIGSGSSAAAALDEPRTTNTVEVDDGTTTDPTPTPPNGNLSFLVTSSTDTIRPDFHAHTFDESCPQGWYVRPAQGSVETPTDLNPAYITNASSIYIDEESSGISGQYDSSNPWSTFQSFYVKFTNSGAWDDHEVSIQYWCDELPSWYPTSATTARTGTPAHAAASSGPHKPAGAPRATSAADGIGPVPYQCYYCSFGNVTLTNYETNLALDWSNAANGAPVTVQDANNSTQQWYLAGGSGGSDFMNGIATMGVWRQTNFDLDWAIAENPANQTVSFTDGSSGEPPNYGRWYYDDDGAGEVEGAIWLINTQTGDCLTATGGPGSNVVGAPCDGTNNAQLWVATQPNS